MIVCLRLPEVQIWHFKSVFSLHQTLPANAPHSGSSTLLSHKQPCTFCQANKSLLLGVPVASLRAKTPLTCTQSRLNFCSQGACVACQGQGFLREEDTIWSTPRRKKSWDIREREGLRLVAQGIAWGWARNSRRIHLGL